MPARLTSPSRALRRARVTAAHQVSAFILRDNVRALPSAGQITIPPDEPSRLALDPQLSAVGWTWNIDLGPMALGHAGTGIANAGLNGLGSSEKSMGGGKSTDTDNMKARHRRPSTGSRCCSAHISRRIKSCLKSRP